MYVIINSKYLKFGKKITLNPIKKQLNLEFYKAYFNAIKSSYPEIISFVCGSCIFFRKGNPLSGHYRVNQRIAASCSRSSVTDKLIKF